LSVAWKVGAALAGAPVVAGGLVWFVDGGGTLRAVDPGSGSVVRQASVGPTGLSLPSLAGAGGRLFVPAGHQVVCFTGA
jgi:hypothetical protein